MSVPPIVAAVLLLAIQSAFAEGEPRRPNILLVISDDQGHGDLGFHGNPVVRTPQLDALARQSVRLKNFYVSPVCAPTRASLLTGRYNYRTGVVDTYLGRALMHADEVTLAELLRDAGYRTGIFGKWHLGDNYPLRPIDQGFQEALVLKGGGIGQPSDPPGGESYFDPLLLHNGQWTRAKGYCSDVFTDAAIRFLEQGRDAPFFCYLAFNAPHTPLQVPERYEQLYRQSDFTAGFPNPGQPMGKVDPAATAKVYGMVTNIDDNLGRLLNKLDERKLAGNTIVVFLTDNGPQQARYNSGLRGRKGSVYDGGIRVPCFIRWPLGDALRGRLGDEPSLAPSGRDVEQIAAHIDIVPTLLEACGVAQPQGRKLDGVSLLPLLKGEPVRWPARPLFFQWHRGDEPELYRAFAARTQRWKLVQAAGVAPGKVVDKPRFELFDMQADPFEMNDLAGQHPNIIEQLKREYGAWFKDVSGTRGYAPPRIHLGTPHENPTVLTRQDWRGPRAGWGPKDLGHWEVQVATTGNYEITLHLLAPAAGMAQIRLGKTQQRTPVPQGEKRVAFARVGLDQGSGRLEAWIEANEQEPIGVRYVEVRLLE